VFEVLMPPQHHPSGDDRCGEEACDRVDSSMMYTQGYT